MNRIVAIIQVLLLVFVAVGHATEVNPKQAKTVAEVEKLGGKVTVDKRSPDKPVIGVGLSHTRLTDAGLVHLEGLAQLQLLDMRYTEITGVGLEHLKGLPRLQVLQLMGSKVTDAGLVHLNGLIQLQWMLVRDTKVIDEGVRKLQQALPNCKIEH